MKKNKHYFLRLAIIKTMVSGLFYLFMPVIATIYHNIIGNDSFENYFGYIVFAGTLLILGNIILVVRAWVIALDKDARDAYLAED